jgi:hypothetical protein
MNAKVSRVARQGAPEKPADQAHAEPPSTPRFPAFHDRRIPISLLIRLTPSRHERQGFHAKVSRVP